MAENFIAIFLINTSAPNSEASTNASTAARAAHNGGSVGSGGAGVDVGAAGLVPYTSYSNIVLMTGSLNAVLCTLGIVANIVSLRTFLAMNGILQEGVTLTLFALTLSDLGLCVASLCWTVAATCYTVEHRLGVLHGRGFYLFSVDPRALGIYFVNVMSVFGVTTTLITTYLAVARCLCVLMPLRFRRAFSPARTVVVTSLFLLVVLATRLPLFALMDIRPRFDPRTNVTRWTRWYHPDRELVKDVLRSAVDIPLPVVAEVTLTFCVIVMVRALRASRKFRDVSCADVKISSSEQRRFKYKYTSDRNSAPTPASKPDDKGRETTNPAGNTAHGCKLSAKEFRVVKQLVIISCTYMVCNLPKLVRILADSVEPEFKLSGRYRNLYDIASHVQFMADTANSGVNLFIYLAFNARFREKCCLVHLFKLDAKLM
ncbi:hypothetical protein EGW08_005060 [Elysia chlorotica]|uniref:G-protein coupled receptors family 1 profile domain-containing protein n=1 Tax=Elysia chlorotica TaxID=188477 RepID=A0A3S0ZVU5_ELYCH|nr:hypothetical protein EGW08_005060 [Elysia chlorotica]